MDTLNFGTGIEGTGFPHHPDVMDIFSLTRHSEYVAHDLDLVINAGISEYRATVPWQRIQPEEHGPYDWTWTDRYMGLLQQAEFIRVSFDLCHHVSYPKWLTDGFLDDRFCSQFVRFAQAFAERYPWARWFTLVNEPLATLLFCGHDGVWHPYKSSNPDFVAMVKNVCRTISLAAEAVRQVIPDARFLHTDTCEFHQSRSGWHENYARFANERRFLIDDVLMGRMNTGHRLWWYLNKHGWTEHDAAWFENRPSPIDERGLDYYWMHEHLYTEAGDLVAQEPLGLAAIGMQYAAYLNLPLSVTETNLRGYCGDRLLWLLLQLREAEKLAAVCDLRAFYWYPFKDSRAWSSLVQNPESDWDPTGLVIMDQNEYFRFLNPLYDTFRLLALNKVDVHDVPLPRPKEPVARQIAGYLTHLENPVWVHDEHEVIDYLTVARAAEDAAAFIK